MHSTTLTAAQTRLPRTVRRRQTARGRAPLIRDVQRARRRLRCLNTAYMEAENKPLVQHLIEAKFEDLRTLHDALPADLREKSWLFTLERHDGWYG
jgi:hypothetical protein